jgi:hypothetical protein
MKRKRKSISLAEQLAAALACLLPQAQRDELRHAKASAKSVIRLFTMHHLDYHALGGSDAWFNLHPLPRKAHAERFGQDAAAIAKVKRLQRQFRPELVGGMVALVEVMDRQIPRQGRREGAGARSGKPKPKQRISQRARPWPPRGSRPMRWKDAPWPTKQ